MRSLWLNELLICLCLMASSGVTLATSDGNDAGNGGYGVVCRTPGGQIASVELFDLWYARHELQLKAIASTKNPLELANEMVLKLYEASPGYFDGLLASYANVAQAQVKLSQKLMLMPPETFLGNLLPAPTTGCAFEPLAVYADSGILLTDGPRWDFLRSPANPIPSNVHTAAFYVHESIGNMLRGRKTRKEVAKDTVNITAIAFTAPTDKELAHRLLSYFQTGEIHVVPKIDRIDTQYEIFADSPQDDAIAKCEQWKQDTLNRIRPLSVFALINCTEVSGNRFVPQGTSMRVSRPAYALASVTAVPKRAVQTFHDDIRSALIPYEQYAGDKAFESWRNRSDAWLAAQQKRFGSQLYFAITNDGVPQTLIERDWQWQMATMVGGYEYRSGIVGVNPLPRDAFASFASVNYDHRLVGVYDTSKGEVNLFVRSTNFVTHERGISAPRWRFFNPASEAIERQAAANALQSFEAACNDFLDSEYRANAVFATCARNGVTYRLDPAASEVWFESEGEAWFYDE